MKKVKIVCRPDHSINILTNTNLFKNKNIALEAVTFNAAHQNSFLSQLVKKISVVDDSVKIFHFITFLEHLNRMFIKRGIDTGRVFYGLCDFLFRCVLSENDEIVHLWSMYCYGEWLKKSKGTIIVDCYEANPRYVESIYRQEYQQHGFSFDKSNLFRYKHNYNTINIGDHIMVPSEYVVESYSGDIDKDKFIINEYGVLGHTYDEDQICHNKKKMNFVYVGRVCLEKGIMRLIDLAERIKNNKLIEINIVGPIDHNIMAIIKSIKLKNIHFHGAKPKKDIKTYLKTADCMIMPSLSDAYCIAVIEALSVGIPVIVSSRTGCKDVVTKNNLGLVFDVDDVDQLESIVLAYQELSLVELNHYKERIRSYFESESNYSYLDRLISIYKKL